MFHCGLVCANGHCQCEPRWSHPTLVTGVTLRGHPENSCSPTLRCTVSWTLPGLWGGSGFFTVAAQRPRA